jgi:hypothetical protein
MHVLFAAMGYDRDLPLPAPVDPQVDALIYKPMRQRTERP